MPDSAGSDDLEIEKLKQQIAAAERAAAQRDSLQNLQDGSGEMVDNVEPLDRALEVEESVVMNEVPEGSFAEGWYPVPDSDQERFWDGSQWTRAYRPGSGQNPASQASTRNQPGYEGLAIASMVLGIVSIVIWYFGLVTGIVGLVLGLKALPYCQPQGSKRGRGMAKAGIICSIVALSIWGLVIVIALIAAAAS